jgi:peroxiredoxin family protein
MATPVSTTGPAPKIPDESTQKLQDAVVSARGALKRCYEDALIDSPYLSVEVEVTVHVDDRGRGSIKKIDGPALPDGMKRCVTNVLTGIAYPPNNATDVNVPLAFKSTTL